MQNIEIFNKLFELPCPPSIILDCAYVYIDMGFGIYNIGKFIKLTRDGTAIVRITKNRTIHSPLIYIHQTKQKEMIILNQ